MKTPYDSLPLIPTIIADAVCGLPYTGQEISVHLRSASDVERVESRRRAMTPEQRREFADLCEVRCRAAYKAEAEWFLKCVRSKTNAGRDRLYLWIAHWLTAYLHDPEAYRERMGSDLVFRNPPVRRDTRGVLVIDGISCDMASEIG